jgi:hypothetical protein
MAAGLVLCPSRININGKFTERKYLQHSQFLPQVIK